MPIDPSIPLQVRTPNLAEVYLRSQQIKGLQQEGQLRQMSLQQAMQGQQDNQDLRAAYAQQDPVAALRQTNPYQAAQLQKQLDAQAAAKLKSDAEQRKLDLENNLKKAQGLGSLANAATPENWQQIKQAAVEQFGADPNKIPDQFDPNIVAQYKAQAVTAQEHIANALAQHNADALERHNLQTETTAAATQAETAKYHGIEAKQRQQEIGIQGARLNLERQKQNTDNDASIETQAQQVANYDLPAPPQSRMNPRNAAVWKRALEINPKLSTSGFTTKQNFKTKGDAQQIESLSTALEHLDNAQQNSKAVGFAPLLGMNATQSDTRYNKDIQLYTEEVGKLIKNGVVTMEELHDLQSGLNSSRQGIRDAALSELTNLLGGKVKAKFQKYKTGTGGQDLNPKEFFDDATQKRLATNGIIGSTEGSGKIRARDPQGNLHEAPAGTPLPAGWKAE